jgi:hypothetical protein
MRQAWAGTTPVIRLPEHLRGVIDDIGALMNKAASAALGVLILVAVTACGSDKSDDKDEVTLSKAEKDVAANIAKAFGDSSGALTEKESSCFAESFVSEVGLEKLESAKLIDENGELNQASASFDAEISGEFADAFLGCVDYTQRQAEEIAKTDKTIDAKALESCLAEEMPDSFVKKLIVASQTQSEDAATLGEESTKKLTDCKTEATTK